MRVFSSKAAAVVSRLLIDQSAESMLAGLPGLAGLAGLAGLGGLSTEAGLAGLSTETGLAGLSIDAGLAGLSTDAGLAGLSTEAGDADAGESLDNGLEGESLDDGETMLSLVTLKSRSAEPVPCCWLPIPGTLRPVALSMSGMALATVAAPPASTPTLSAEAAPMAIQFLLSMVFLPLACRAARVDGETLTGGNEITRRSR